jgi:hypothetical protein
MNSMPTPTKQKLDEPLSFVTSRRQANALRKRADQEEVSISVLIRRAIKALLDGKVKV